MLWPGLLCVEFLLPFMEPTPYPRLFGLIAHTVRILLLVDLLLFGFVGRRLDGALPDEAQAGTCMRHTCGAGLRRCRHPMVPRRICRGVEFVRHGRKSDCPVRSLDGPARFGLRADACHALVIAYVETRSVRLRPMSEFVCARCSWCSVEVSQCYTARVLPSASVVVHTLPRIRPRHGQLAVAAAAGGSWRLVVEWQHNTQADRSNRGTVPCQG